MKIVITTCDTPSQLKDKWWINCCSAAQLCLTLCDLMDCSTPGFPILHYFLEFLKLTSIELVMPSNNLILCPPLLLLPSIFPSIMVSSAHSFRWPKYWSFSFSISPSNEYLGLISFRIDWFDFLAVQGTLKSLLQHHGSKASILLFFLSNSHISTWLLEKPYFWQHGPLSAE